MNLKRHSVKRIFWCAAAGALASMAAVTAAFYVLTGSRELLLAGAALTSLALLWLVTLLVLFEKRLSDFAADLCRTLDSMIDGEKPTKATDSETLFSRISHRLGRLYEILQEGQRQARRERQELQILVSDISHQVKTPVSNLRMVTDTLLTKPVSSRERTDFLKGIKSQTEKLDFLFQAMVKTSRLETGMIRLEKKESRLYDTLAEALSSIFYPAENKGIEVTVDCPEALTLPHDGKWTAEALFNLLDNGVKYTPAGGRLTLSVKQWELYVRIDVADTGIGIPESSQGAVFRRFYREEEVHGVPGVGIGLYLAREIITMQGGYITVTSEPGKGSVFSVFLPCR